MARTVVQRGSSPTNQKPSSGSADSPSESSHSIVSEAGSAEGDANISRPVEVTTAKTESTMNGQTGYSGVRIPPVDYSLLPGGHRALCSIALHAFALGITLGISFLATPYLAYHHYRIWRVPEFAATLAIFHFLEFYTTSRWNTVNAKVSSYLLFSNGAAYNVAHASAMLEIVVSSLFFPNWQSKYCNAFTIAVGAFLVIMGQVVRSVAMAKAGKSFNHIPQRQKREDHVLVTTGIYSWSRHPSYFGYYWFAVGTQIVVGNKICALVYAVVLWSFFNNRIPDEERYLIEFFGNEYENYKANTGTGLPFIP